MNLAIPPVAVLGVLAAFVTLTFVWRMSVRRARRIATAGRNSARLATLTGRVVVATGLLGAVQWLVIAHPVDRVLTVVALGLPDLLAAFVLVRALTVTTVNDRPRERGERR